MLGGKYLLPRMLCHFPRTVKRRIDLPTLLLFHILNRIQLRKKYQRVWRERVEHKHPTKELQKEIDDLEADPRLDVFNIIIARQRASMEWDKVKAQVKKKGTK